MTCLGYFFSLAKCPQISYQARVEEDESNPQGETSNPQVFEGGGSGLVPEIDWGASTTHIEQGASTSQNEQGASTAQNEQGASTAQNEQGASTAQEPRIIGTPQSGEEFPLANILSQPRSVEAADVASPVQPSDRNDNSEPIELPIAGVPVTADNAADEVPLAVDEGRPEDNATAAAEEANAQIPGNTSGEKQAIQTQPKSKKKGRGALAPTDKSLWPALDFMQMDNTLVKPVDLLPRKLLILDVEGVLLYAEGFMDKTSRTDCGDVISNGMKAVVRRNGVQALMSRCLELFDVALWSCCSRNTLWDYTHYLFSGEQYNKFLFMWDYNKALDTKEKWTRDNRQISLLLKPLKAVWERYPDFNARNTLLVDVNPYRASANPENTGIFPVPYIGSRSDTYLTSVLLPYLEGLSQAYDIREYVLEHALQGSQRPLHFRATSRGLPGLLHKFSAQAVETYVPPLLTKRKKLTDYEKDVLRRLPDIDELGDHDCVAWARLLGLSWNQSLEDDLTTVGLSDENRARHSSTKASVKYARDFLLEVKSVNFA
ncbi:hypothetical protein R1sor_005978 [Riccia sorocarpa]|uniref:Mitochondrial import inner membrane translocase subunit TIM50 n=1 Tax=Riccia sorocarpa TaxID=122646 RepID=A0ABD3HLC5_9MARC